jgi:hypothetical protein
MPVDALNVFEPQLLAAAVKEAYNPAHVPPGELRKLEEMDQYGQVRAIRFIGQDWFCGRNVRFILRRASRR